MVDTARVCPECLQENAISNGYCRFCKKRIVLKTPIGVLPPGYVLHGRYLTGTFLGQGGFGTIYKALDLINRRVVAVKEYFPTMWCSRLQSTSQVTVKSPEEFKYGLKHFKGEAEILHSLQFIPEVVRLYDSFEENGTGYYVMEFLEGENLQKYLKSHREKISFYETVALLMPAILALKKVHDAGTTHRDISPDNIYLCRDGSLRIIDFGAAASTDSVLSRSFIPIEKEGYSPPEQHTISSRGDTQGTWSDIYAMAGTIYHCTVGKRPPSASARMAGDELDFSNSGLTQQQIQVLKKNLSLKMRDRTQTMMPFAKELVACLSPAEAKAICARYPELARKTVVPPPPPPPESRAPSVQIVPSVPPIPQIPSNPSNTSASGSSELPRRAAAFLLDMFFFQLCFLAFAMMAGVQELFGYILFLLGGDVLGIVVTWLMTASQPQGSPGEVLCGLEVTCDGRQPDQREALLYCLIRMFWPILLFGGAIFYLARQESILTELSGCCAQSKGSAPGGKRLAIQITTGFYKGSTIPIAPGRFVFGRNPERCNIIFPMRYNVVSQVHMELTIDGAYNIYVINRSNHGTWVDNRRLSPDERTRADVGTKIVFGQETLTISAT